VRENHVWRRKGLTRGKCLLAGEGWAVELYWEGESGGNP
jgi:hypothetical protein